MTATNSSSNSGSILSFRDALVGAGIDKDIVEAAISHVRLTGEPLEDVLQRSAPLSEHQLGAAFAAALELPFEPLLGEKRVPPIFLDKVPVEFAREAQCVAIGRHGNLLRVATSRPFSGELLDEVARLTRKAVEPVVAIREEVVALVNRAFSQQRSLVDEMLDTPEEDIEALANSIQPGEDLMDLADKAPVVRLVNMFLFQALKMRASDVHIQPFEDRLQVRFRIDGVLYPMFSPPKKVQDAITSRVKVMANMDIAERRLPQDGRTSVRLGNNEVDLRVSSIPTAYGERIVLRLLDKKANVMTLPDLGYYAEDLERFRRLLALPHGLILVTGPTGSGKTTTLYAGLLEINAAETNIITIEDPIEYQLSGVSQIQVSEKKGMTFASGLRSILRQDPDVIMVGEIRDVETASIAIEASNTGHLVFSTLHTNDSASAAIRLLDLGVEPYLLSSSLAGVIAQRLVRLNCPRCSVPYIPDKDMLKLADLKEANLEGRNIRKGTGCDFCMNTGYFQRKGIYEMMVVDGGIRTLIYKQNTAASIKTTAVASGMRTLRSDGFEKFYSGQTTLREVLRVTQMDVI